MKNFKNLKIWQKGMDIAEGTYKVTRNLPREELLFALASQMNRAGISIPSNIAEGSSRKSEKEQGRFIEISLGSSYELETQLLLCERIYPNIPVAELLQQLEEEQKMLTGFYNKLTF